MTLLSIGGLSITVDGADSPVVRNVSFGVEEGETVALVGESGSGKTLTALSVLGLLPDNVRATTGSIQVAGRELRTASEQERRAVRGREIGMVYQEPLSAFNPVHRIGTQIVEALEIAGVRGAEATDRMAEVLREVGLPHTERVARAYPHQLSGGQRQRALLAMAIAPRPRMLIADEPTTALDVTVQQQILALVDELRERLGLGVLWITHDLGVVARIAQRALVMQHGELVEQAEVRKLFAGPAHNYTKRLLAAATGAAISHSPRRQQPRTEDPVLRVQDLARGYRLPRGGIVRAVDGVSFSLARGETLGVVGESGCGKSTTARMLVRLEDPDAGSIELDGHDITRLRGSRMRAARRDIQLVFQDPYASLQPRATIGSALSEVLSAHRLEPDQQARRKRVVELLELVGLPASATDRYPHQLSGGQRQRVGIARALSLSPKVLVLDEPVSALDVSVRADIIDLLVRLRAELGLSYVFISHDLSVVREISDRIAVMYAGRIVEVGPSGQVSADPVHPYARALQAAEPLPDPEARAPEPLQGEVPDPASLPSGCPFHPRCSLAQDSCTSTRPNLLEVSGPHLAACPIATAER